MSHHSELNSLALVAILGVVCVFFFPAPSGSFTATNGPATAFRALLNAVSVFCAMCAIAAVFANSVCGLLQGQRDPRPAAEDGGLIFNLRC